MITREILREHLNYDAESGLFYRKRSHLNTKAGEIASSINPDGYRTVRINGRRYLQHHLAWLEAYGCMPPGFIDHIDGDRRNNRVENLRLATKQQNNCNRKIRSNNTSGLKGVSFNRKTRKWQAEVCLAGRKFYLGLFNSKELAHDAYCKKAKELHGEFFRAK